MKQESKNSICEKIGYRSEESAYAALRAQQRWGANVARVYKCLVCRGIWHLTSEEAGWKQKVKKAKKRQYKSKWEARADYHDLLVLEMADAKDLFNNGEAGEFIDAREYIMPGLTT